MYKVILYLLMALPCRAQNIIAYYSGDAAAIDRYPVNGLTHIIYSFCHLKGNRLTVGSTGDSATIQKLVKLKRRYPHLKILLSLGGWGGCKTCSPVFATAGARAAFTESVVSLTRFFQTDGIDIDWEFPGFAAFPGHPFLPNDKDHLTALLQSLRSALGADKDISFIAAGFAPYLQQSINWPEAMRFATRVNLMTYDIIGSRSPITGHHAALYPGSVQKESADHALKYLDSLGVPASKIAIGAAFYAREFDGVPGGAAHGLYQPGKFKRFIPMKQLRRHYTAANGYIEYWDEQAKAAWRYNPARKIFLTYDDKRSIAAKAAYVKEKRLNGIMFWELRLDVPHGGLADILYQELK